MMNKISDNDTDEVRRIINDKIYFINNIKIDFTTHGMYKAYEILLSSSVLEHSIVNILEQMLISSVSCNIQKYSINKDDKKELITNNRINDDSHNTNSSWFHNGSIMIECIHMHSSSSSTTTTVASLSYVVGGGSSLSSSSATNQSVGWDKINIYIGTYCTRDALGHYSY